METITQKSIVSHFEKLGAKISFSEDTRRGIDENHFNINIRTNKKLGEHYIITVGDNVNVTIPNIDKKKRHLLVNVAKKDKRNQTINEKYLCGHDERHWFVATVPTTAINVNKAMDLLKPSVAENSQKRSNVRKKDLHKRHNKGYKRQGEWFFIPRPNFVPDENFIFKNEPIRRGRGKAHICETLCRKGGEPVMVSALHPNGLTMKEYEDWRLNYTGKRNYIWNPMTRDAEVFVKGKITHPDHKTLELEIWHLVVPNTEEKASHFKVMAFLD